MKIEIVERVVEKVVEKRVEVPVPVLDGDALLKVQALQELTGGLSKDLPALMGLLSALMRDYAPGAAAAEAPAEALKIVPEPEAKVEPVPSPTRRPSAPRPKTAKPILSPTVSLPDGARRILVSLSRHRKQRLSKAAIGARAGLKWKTSGTFNTYMREHFKAGRIEQDGDLFRITDAGMQALGLDPQAETEPETTAEILQGWRDALSNREFEALEILVAAAPKGMSQDELRDRMGLAAGSGTFNGYLRTLKVNGLIEGNQKRWTAATVLFP